MLLHPITEAVGDVRDLVKIVEGVGTKKRSRFHKIAQSAPQGNTQSVALLLGMVYTADSYMRSKLQLTRDGIRCRALERSEQVAVYTIDVGHDVSQAQHGRYICYDFANIGLLGKMDEQWIGLTFRYILMDYFYTPSAWHAERWNEQMYTVTLPILAAKGPIPLHGEVWLPHINCIAERLDRLWEYLEKWFTKHYIGNPMQNPLFRATEKVTDELTADLPFIVLRCITSGDGLEYNQSAGCGSLMNNTSEAPLRTLRPRL